MILSVIEFDTKWVARPVDRLLLCVSVISAVAYLVSQPEPAGSAVVKSLAVSPLALMAISRLQDRDGFVLGGALLLSAIGDLLLGIDPDRLFVFGLAAFLVAHLLYIVLFALNKNQPAITGSNSEATVGAVLRDRPSPGRSAAEEPINPSPARDLSRPSPGAGAIRRLIAVVVTAYTASMLIWLWPSLGDLRLPVLAYICVITAMGVMSLLAGFPSWIVPAGALLFMLSDSLIAVSKFKHPIRYENYLIWCTYYVGQVCITMGFLRYRESPGPGRYRSRY